MQQVQYELTLNAEQARILTDALEFFERIGMGQVSEMIGMLHPERNAELCKLDNTDEIEGAFNLLKLRVYPELSRNQYHTIRSERIGDRYRVAYDLHQVIRNQIAKDQGSTGWHTWLSEPLRTSHKGVPLAVITKVTPAENLAPVGNK